MLRSRLAIRLAVAAATAVLFAITAIGSTAADAYAAGGPSPEFTANVWMCGFDPFVNDAHIEHDHNTPVLVTEYGVPVQLTQRQWRLMFRKDPYGYFRLTFIPPVGPIGFDNLEGGIRLSHSLTPGACYFTNTGPFLDAHA